MKRSLPFVLSMLCASAVLAEAPAPTQHEARNLVQRKLVNPMGGAQGKRKAFSRAAPPPTNRRVRVLGNLLTDVRGKRFLRFAIDERFAWDDDGEWREDAMRGCAYPEEGHVFVQRGDEYVSASSLLGKQPRAKADVCREAPADEGTVARADG